MFRDALVVCFRAQPECVVVGNVSRLDDLRSVCRLRRPDVAVVDVGAGRVDLESLRDCVALTKVVVVYESLTLADLGELCRIGVDTLIPSSHGLDALLVVLRRYLAEDPAAVAQDGFTELEKQIMTLVSAGHTVHEIAQLLETSTSSVANIKRRIYRKLQVVSQGQAVARATALGILTQPATAFVRPECPECPAGAVLGILRGTAGPAWQQVVDALRAGGIPFTTDAGGQVPQQRTDGLEPVRSPIVLVDPAPEDWPVGPETGAPVVLVRTVPPHRQEAIEALLRGARVVMTADHVATDLVPALTLATHGHVTVEGEVARAALQAVRSPAVQGLPELTSRELDILRLIANGHTMRQTARALGIAEKTVENTQSRLYRKLGARNRASALVAAHALGLLELLPHRS
jgi:two-component system, NarL family, nitrate/nitrite response regulator NarL